MICMWKTVKEVLGMRTEESLVELIPCIAVLAGVQASVKRPT
jgi:hypothetical protein